MKNRSVALVIDRERLAETLLRDAVHTFVADRRYASEATRRQAWERCTSVRAVQSMKPAPVNVRKAGR